jgi:hypothetical protein
VVISDHGQSLSGARHSGQLVEINAARATGDRKMLSELDHRSPCVSRCHDTAAVRSARATQTAKLLSEIENRDRIDPLSSVCRAVRDSGRPRTGRDFMSVSTCRKPKIEIICLSELRGLSETLDTLMTALLPDSNRLEGGVEDS